ncbi:hypothetical protein [Paenimyroides baculatum]|uniref:Uncharacterized protein n=1 Tax=Paenimyroides baculatum TaxID=2608000 RepID=A0A5M6CC73_9FLAO|nr:hypothetical protein [Paenimyroides baculatum]KAA5532798.1 hypothetical protein F0460_13210 [Paenimyroides baculatum]
MPDIPLDDINGESCEPSAGLSTDLYFIERKNLATMTDPKDLCGDSPNAAATLEELIEISGTPGHTLKPDKKWEKLEFIQETPNIKSTQIGEKERRLFQNELAGQIVGSKARLLGFMRWVKNKKLICLIREIGTKNLRQMGSDEFAAWIETQEHIIEGPREGVNGLNITIADKQQWPAPIYKGDVVTTVTP